MPKEASNQSQERVIKTGIQLMLDMAYDHRVPPSKREEVLAINLVKKDLTMQDFFDAGRVAMDAVFNRFAQSDYKSIEVAGHRQVMVNLNDMKFPEIYKDDNWICFHLGSKDLPM